MRRTLIAAAWLVLSACSSSEDTIALCRAIAETPKIAVQPRDRVFWDKECVDYRRSIAPPPPPRTPCVPLSAGKVWSGSCREDDECSSCRCVDGMCTAPNR